MSSTLPAVLLLVSLVACSGILAKIADPEGGEGESDKGGLRTSCPLLWDSKNLFINSVLVSLAMD